MANHAEIVSNVLSLNPFRPADVGLNDMGAPRTAEAAAHMACTRLQTAMTLFAQAHDAQADGDAGDDQRAADAEEFREQAIIYLKNSLRDLRIHCAANPLPRVVAALAAAE